MSRIYTQQKRPVAKASEPSYSAPTVHAPSMVSGASSADLDSMMQAKFRQHFLDNQIPTAEAEADRIAASVSGARTPEEVKTQLGEKMGADFSGVTFHTDSAALKQADAMGARAYTTGSDVYFGQGGFDPGVAAHELVHTVQQGMVGSTMQTTSAPTGGVQMKEGGFFSRLKRFFSRKPKPTPHLTNVDPMPSMYKYASTLAQRAADRDKRNQAKAAAGPADADVQQSVEEAAPTAAPGAWKMGISPRQQYLDQINSKLSMSNSKRYDYLLDTRLREAKRHIAWHNTHMGEGATQTPYEGAFGTRVYSNDRNYQIMNSLLRTGTAPKVVKDEKVHSSEIEDAKIASDALSRNLREGEHTRLEEDTVVHRGATRGFGNALMNQLPSKDGVNADNLVDHINGQIFTDKAFTSTSIHPDRAKAFSGLNTPDAPERNMIHAVLPKGLKTQFVSPSSEYGNEDEMLVDRNTPMRVLEAKKKPISESNSDTYREIKAVFLRGLAGGHRKKKK